MHADVPRSRSCWRWRFCALAWTNCICCCNALLHIRTLQDASVELTFTHFFVVSSNCITLASSIGWFFCLTKTGIFVYISVAADNCFIPRQQWQDDCEAKIDDERTDRDFGSHSIVWAAFAQDNFYVFEAKSTCNFSRNKLKHYLHWINWNRRIIRALAKDLFR